MNDSFSASHPDIDRPGLVEIAVGLVMMAIVGFGLAILLMRLPIDRGNLGLILTGWSGVAGFAGFGAAWLVRRRPLREFGVRATSFRWLMLGVAAGVFAFLMKGVLVIAVVQMVGPVSNPQGVYALGGSGGALLLLLATLLLGVFTPLGEEFLFRGVVTNGLLRYGAVAGVIGGALIFALLHGINIVFPAAVVEGLVAGEIFRRSGSVWPAVAVHVVYNLPTVPIMVMTQSA